jgi:integrase
MAVIKRGNTWWYEFIFAGKRIRESAKTTSKTVAKEAEKNRRRALERSLAGMPIESAKDRIRTVIDVVRPYVDRYSINHRQKSVACCHERLAHIRRLLGNVLIPDLTEDVVLQYAKTRLAEGVSGRTVNMELQHLSAAIGKPWSILWPKVRRLEERKDVGKALSPEEEKRLLEALSVGISPNKSKAFGTIIRIALLTAMRCGEITRLKWEQIDLANRVVTVGRAKTASGSGRQIPMNRDLFTVLSMHAHWFTERFGEARPELYLFPFGSPTPNDPTRPTTTLKTAWTNVRKAAGLNCRLHDLRHTALTKMAEAGVPESTMKALAGHMSAAMIERYSHIRMAAKRRAVEALSFHESGVDCNPITTKSTTVEQARAVQ